MKTEATKLLTTIGFKLENITFVPISAWKGDNIVKKSENLKWFNLPYIIGALDNIKAPAPPIDKALVAHPRCL